MLIMLVLSSFLPNYYTLNEKQWYELEKNRPDFFWICSHFSTPFLVTNPAFLIVSLFLFLSTLVCTITRVQKWFAVRESEFTTDKAFSFSVEERLEQGRDSLSSTVHAVLSSGGWEKAVQEKGESCIISGQKGMSGFWGSVVFHAGMIIVFFAGPLSVYTTFRGELVLTEGFAVPLQKGFYSHVGKDPSTLPDVQVKLSDFRTEFFEGKYKYDFGGILTIEEMNDRREFPFAVNQPVEYKGYQLSLHEYGYAPHVIIQKDGVAVFDYYLNLKHPEEGDSFLIESEKLRAELFFFPDFVRDGDRLGSKSRLPENPVTFVKLFRDEKEVFNGLFKPGEARTFGQYTVAVSDYRRWANLVVVRESGILALMLGLGFGLSGLFARFMSNERRLEFVLVPQVKGTMMTVRGYSRYYPAFLEEEVLKIAQRLKESDHVVL